MFLKEPVSFSAMSSGSINGEELTRSWFLPVCVQKIYGAWHDLALELYKLVQLLCFVPVLFHHLVHFYSYHLWILEQLQEFTCFSEMLQDQQGDIFLCKPLLPSW